MKTLVQSALVPITMDELLSPLVERYSSEPESTHFILGCLSNLAQWERDNWTYAINKARGTDTYQGSVIQRDRWHAALMAISALKEKYVELGNEDPSRYDQCNVLYARLKVIVVDYNDKPIQPKNRGKGNKL